MHSSYIYTYCTIIFIIVICLHTIFWLIMLYRFWLQIRYLQTLHVLVSRLGMNCYSMWKNLICVTKDPSYVMFVLVTISCSLRFHDLTDFKKRNTNIATITATTTYLSVLFFFLVLVSQSLIFSVFCESLYIFPI